MPFWSSVVTRRAGAYGRESRERERERERESAQSRGRESTDWAQRERGRRLRRLGALPGVNTELLEWLPARGADLCILQDIDRS